MRCVLRRGLELMDCAERSCPALEGSSEAPLSRNRRTADQECRGPSPRSPVQGLARLLRKTVACTAGLVGRPEPAGHKSIRSRGEVRAQEAGERRVKVIPAIADRSPQTAYPPDGSPPVLSISLSCAAQA